MPKEQFKNIHELRNYYSQKYNIEKNDIFIDSCHRDTLKRYRILETVYFKGAFVHVYVHPLK